MADNQVDIKKLLEAGAHFGHKTSRWHPKMAPYIHSKRGGIHIIDLAQTVDKINEAMNFLASVAGSGKQILLVGTKRQAKDIILEMANKTKMPFVTERWLGGTLTNWSTISKRVQHLKDLENKMSTGELANKYNKLEVQRYQEEIDKLNLLYGGIKDMNNLPGAVFISDAVHDSIALREAIRTKIPVVAIVDSNADPSNVAYPIPANDDAIKTIKLITEYLESAIINGSKTKSPKEK